MTKRILFTIALLLTASLAFACSDSGARVAPAGTPAGTNTPPGGLYIALGDSLSAGVGASGASTTFVALVHASFGGAVALENLGVSGATSQDLLDRGSLDRAAGEIEERNRDDDPANDVRLVTLEIGGNDLLSIYFSLVQTGACPDLETALTNPECTDALTSTFEGFRPNLTAVLDRLHDADPELPVLLLTLYNPFDYLPNVGPLGDLSLEGQPDTPFEDGLNDVIRAIADGRGGVTVVDIYPLFRGRSLELISPDGVHPNDAGYRVMADAVIAALR